MKYFKDCITLEDVKGLYKKLVFKHHPDKGGDTAIMPARSVVITVAFEPSSDTPDDGAEKLNVRFVDTVNGVVVADKRTAAYGEKVSLTAYPDSGYALSNGSIQIVSGGAVVTDNSFTMPEEDVTVTAEFKLDEGLGLSNSTQPPGTVNAGEVTPGDAETPTPQDESGSGATTAEPTVAPTTNSSGVSSETGSGIAASSQPTEEAKDGKGAQTGREGLPVWALVVAVCAIVAITVIVIYRKKIKR